MGTAVQAIDPTYSALNPDLAALVDTSFDTAKQTRFLKVMAFEPPSDMDGLKAEVDRVFNDGLNAKGGSTDEAPSLDSVTVARSNLPTIARVMIEFQNQSVTSKGQIHVQGALEMAKAISRETVRDLMIHMFGDTDRMRLSRRLSASFEVQMDRIFGAIEQLVPFLDKQDLSPQEVRNMMAEVNGPKYMSDGFRATPTRTFMPLVKRLSRHMELCRGELTKNDGIYTDAATRDGLFDSQEMRHAVFLLIQPWIVFKYVATFVYGPWNKSAWAREMRPSFLDSRNAELALYRMSMDMVTHVRMNIIEHPEALQEKRLLEVIEDAVDRNAQGGMTMEFIASTAKTMYSAGMRTHVFEATGSHDVSVRVGGEAMLLVVGGGGAGGAAGSDQPGGGGGGGEVVTRTAFFDTGEDFTVKVGEGGQGSGG